MIPLFNEERSLSSQTSDRFGISKQKFDNFARHVKREAWSDGLAWAQGERMVPYPVNHGIVQVGRETDEHLAAAVPLVFAALEKVMRAHRSDREVREYLQVPEAFLKWVDVASLSDYRIDLCRFDLVGQDIENGRVVEFNANCPGGTIVNGAYLRLWRSVPEVRHILNDWGADEDLLEKRHWFPKFLLSVGDRDNGAETRPVAIFRKPGGNVFELEKMAALTKEMGHSTIITDPTEADWLRAGSRIGYLKYAVKLALADMGGWTAFLELLADGGMRIINPLPGRWIGDNKLCLGLMSDERFARLFSSAERAAIKALLPYSRKVGDGVEPAELVAHRGEWVLKVPYDTRGNGVFIGSVCEAPEWRQLVDRAMADGWLAQRWITPGTCYFGNGSAYRDLSVVLVGGKLAGYRSRISSDVRVNIGLTGVSQLVVGCGASAWGAQTARAEEWAE